MKRTGIFLLTLFFCIHVSTGVLFAQTTAPAPVFSVRVQDRETEPTSPPKVTTQPTKQPTSTLAPTAIPTTQVTANPTPKVIEPTNAPEQKHQVQTAEPTAVPTAVPPTPTPKPKPLVLANNKKPPEQPISRIITAPFDVVMNSLPQSYYDDQGLAPSTNKVLLAFAGLSLLSGTLLLTWPSLTKVRKRLFTPTVKERTTIPYLDLAGRA